MFKKIIYFFVVLLLSTSIHAKKFANQYCEFELPNGWQCALEGSEWVCQSTNKDRQKEAIIILAAKIRGTQDSLEEYNAYLKSRKTFTLPGGRTQVSEPKYAKMRTISDHRWVDALHLASEVPGFYTRYLATVKSDLGVAVTFSVGKDFYSAYQGVFDKVIETLRVFRQKSGNANKYKRGKSKDLLDGNIDLIPDDERLNIVAQRKKRGGSSTTPTDYMIYGSLAAAAAYGIAKARKKKKPKKKKKKKK